jgi:NADH:ubiquinone oxidoreductase subunit D
MDVRFISPEVPGGLVMIARCWTADMSIRRPRVAFLLAAHAHAAAARPRTVARRQRHVHERTVGAVVVVVLSSLADGPTCAAPAPWRGGAALTAVEAPHGAAFHWLRLDENGTVARYRITPPSFTNWHGFHLAAENFAFQDFPIILASFGLSNAECDR